MTAARFFGIDLAWSERNLSGACALDKDGRIVDEQLIRADDDIVDWIGHRLDGPAVVAIDAPLRVPNDHGMRRCERDLHAIYGGRHAGPFPSNRTLFLRMYGRIRGEDISARLGELGFADPWSRQPRVLLEVYPHPALVEAFELRERLLYKAKRGVGPEGRRVGLRNLARLIAALADADPPLMGSLYRIPDTLRGRGIKGAEDALDARLTAWIAAVWGRHGRERIELHGTSADGHIAVPTGRFVQQSIRIDNVPRRRPGSLSKAL